MTKKKKLQDYWASQQSKLAALQIFFGSLSIFSVRGRRLNYHTRHSQILKDKILFWHTNVFTEGAAKVSVNSENASTLYTPLPLSLFDVAISPSYPGENSHQCSCFLSEKNTFQKHFCHILCFFMFFFHLILVDVYSFMYRHLLVTICMFYLNRKKQKRNIMIRLDLKKWL